MNKRENPEESKVIRRELFLILKGSIADTVGTHQSIDYRSLWLQRVPYGSTNAFNVNPSSGNVNNNNRTNNNYASCW